MRDLNEANVRQALAEVGGPPAALICGPGIPELIARRICCNGQRPVAGSEEPAWEDVPAAVLGIEVRIDGWIAGWRMEKTDVDDS